MDSAKLKQVRREFAERIQRETGLRTNALVEGLATAPREEFVGPGPWKILRSTEMQRGYQTTPDDDPTHLYDTVLVALDASVGLNNGEPSSLVRFLDALDLAPGNRLLHIGCGVGYYTAIASRAVLPGGEVVGVELDPRLAANAQENLKPYDNAMAICADGVTFNGGAFDAIFVNAGVTEIQPSWLDQLNEGGRLLVPLTVAFPAAVPESIFGHAGLGYTLLISKQDERYAARFISPVGIFHCVGARSAEAEKLLGQALRNGRHNEVRSLRRDEHSAGPECWLHAAGFCLSCHPPL